MATATSFRDLSINRLTGTIISSAMHVHSVLGPGLLESAYQGCLTHDLKQRGLAVASQVGLPVIFDGERIELGYRIDLLVENLVIVEVKSVEAIHPVHHAQLLSYMRLSGVGVGLLINFYVLHLRDGIKRMVDGKDWEK
jgi:GxxExxY protein